MKKIVLLLVVALIVFVAIFVRIKTIKSQEGIDKPGIETIMHREGFPVETLPVYSGEFEIWRDIQGKIEGYKQAVISTPMLAKVAVIHYRVGDRVPADVPIISLDENDPKNAARVKLLQSVYEDALREYDRYKSLYESGGISQDIVEKVRLKLKQTKTDLDAARATVHLTSPISGTLMSLHVRVGENAEPEKKLGLVSSLGKVKVVAGVSDKDVAELELKQPVRVKAADGSVYTGYVDRVSLAADEETGLFDLEVVVENPDRKLKVGTYTTAQVRVYNSEDTLYIDQRCILRDAEEQSYIWQVDEGKARRTNIEVIASNDDYFEVQGLNPDFPVIVSGKSLLRDGAELNVLNAEVK